MSGGLEGVGDGDLDGRERADNMESARSIFPILTSFCNESDDANVGENVGLPFEVGEEVVGECLDECGDDWGNHLG